jgi:hypothetical protein
VIDTLLQRVERTTLEKIGSVHSVPGGAQVDGELQHARSQTQGVVEQYNLSHLHAPATAV